jgi:chromosomal replication initiation ATPase DnaA
MTGRPEQLAFDLPATPRLGLADWIVSACNRAAFDTVMRWPDWPSPVVVVAGPEGSGKSHLARIFAERAAARIIAAEALADADPLALAAAGPIVVEDVGPGTDERALFHLLNAARAAGVAVLLTARPSRPAWVPEIADLASRLRAAQPVELAEPDDELLESLIEKLFADRQTRVDPSLPGYLARRMERSFAEAVRLVEALDRASLAAKRPITRAIAAQVLAHDGVDADVTAFDEGDETDETENNPS